MTSQIIKVEPFDLVVFGGTGDLAYRKLFPALFHRDKDEQFNDPTRIIGVSRRHLERDAFRARGRRRRLHKFGGVDAASAAAASSVFSIASTMSRSTSPAKTAGSNLKALLGADERVRAYLYGDEPRPVRPDRQAIGRQGPRDAALAHHRRKADRQGRRERRRDQRRDRLGLPGKPHLPHRPLSRQGDGAEPDGAALRQRAVRAACGTTRISITCRSPSPRRSASRGAAPITTDRAPCATWCKTICCNCFAWWRWSRPPRWRRTRCATRS